LLEDTVHKKGKKPATGNNTAMNRSPGWEIPFARTTWVKEGGLWKPEPPKKKKKEHKTREIPVS